MGCHPYFLYCSLEKFKGAVCPISTTQDLGIDGQAAACPSFLTHIRVPTSPHIAVPRNKE
jgi:hypothetical protein